MFRFIKRWAVRRVLEQVLEQLNKGGQMAFIKAFFGGSKKATAALVAILAIVLRDIIGLDATMVDMIVKIIMTYILGQGAVDVALALKAQK